LAPWFASILAKAWPRTPEQVFVLDWPLLAFGAAISLVCVLLCGLAPAWSASATHVNTVLKDASPTAGRGSGRVQRVFVAAQVALSVGLVAVGALVLGSMRRIVAIEPGFQAQALVTGAMDISLLGYDAELGGRFFTNLLHRISEVPGVRSAALAKSSPAVDWSDRLNIFHPGQMPAEGFTEERAPNAIRTDRNVITPGYFATLGISLIAGRDFRDSDRATSAKVAIVSESLARRLWGGQNAVGRQIVMPVDTRTAPAPTPVEIIGVAADSRYRTVLDEPPLLLYVPLAQNYDSISRVILAVDGPAAGFREPLRRALQSISPDLPVPAPATLQEQIDRSLWDRRAAASLLTLFSALALGLACTGVYGVVAHTAAQRSREIGIRMALGACRSDVRRHIAAYALRLTLAGVAAGIPLALWAKPAAAAFLYRADTAIAPTLTFVAALFTAIALIAAALPAHRAASTDPASVLRGD
jgi:putative ABC transport system permease protein